MAHKKHRGDFKNEDEDEEEESEDAEDFEAEEDDEENDEEETVKKQPAKKEVAKPAQKSTSGKSGKPIEMNVVQAVKDYEPAVQFADGSYVKLNDIDFKVWMIQQILEIKEAIG